MSPESSPATDLRPLGQGARITILVVAFLGWFFGGMQILITNLGMRAASIDLIGRAGWLDFAVFNELNGRANSLVGAEKAQLAEWNAMAAQWYTWFQCAFLLGAAAGGFIFGWLGDKVGRTRALGLAITWFATFTALAYVAQDPVQLLILRFLACLGVGGTWPNGVALVSEVWSNNARPLLSSSIGMAGNLGIFFMARLAKWKHVTPESWQWVMVVNSSAPLVLGIFTLAFVPESPTWKRSARTDKKTPRGGETDVSIFRPPYLRVTLLGIALATIPLMGGWGAANWMMPWADEVGSQIGKDGLKADIGMARSLTSMVGSLAAGLIACWVGRRTIFFLTCLGALLAAQYAFWFTTPGEGSFLFWVAVLGLFNGIFFGWLPFFLPELFPTKIRSTGAGVSFNSGRIFTAVMLFVSGYVVAALDGNYAAIGRITSLVFMLGMVAILFAPDTSKRNMEE